MDLRCWFCDHPAVTIGWGFAVCGGREETPVNCSERARALGAVDPPKAERDQLLREQRRELDRLRAIETAAEDWCVSLDSLIPTEKALYRAVRSTPDRR
jgi:hypothetical protein